VYPFANVTFTASIAVVEARAGAVTVRNTNTAAAQNLLVIGFPLFFYMLCFLRDPSASSMSRNAIYDNPAEVKNKRSF
jgi:hypothetical protein